MRTLPSLLAVATLIVAQLSAQNPVVTDVVRLGDPTTSATQMNFLAMFDQPVSGVDLTDFAPITNISGAIIENIGNNAVQLDATTGATRAFRGSVANFPTTSFTVEFFYAGTDTSGTLFDYETGPFNDNRIRIYTVSGSVVYAEINGSVACIGPVSGNISDGQYRHFALKWTNTTGAAKLFVGGALVDTGTEAAGFVMPSGGAICLGSNMNSNNVASAATFTSPVNGRYDEFKIWSINRTDSEIINERFLARTGDEANLALYWSFDTYEDLGIGTAGENDIRDLTGNGQSPTIAPTAAPALAVGQILSTSRQRVQVRIPSDTCSRTVGLEVLNDGSMTATTGGLPLAAGYTAGETYLYLGIAPALVLPGTGEDFAMAPYVVNGAVGDCALAGETVLVHVASAGGAFNLSVPVIVGQLYAPGAHPGSTFPGLQMDSTIVGPFGIFIVFDGNAAGNVFFGPHLLGPGGLTVGGYLPPGLAGLNVMFQGLALSPLASNGFFATTEGRELQLR